MTPVRKIKQIYQQVHEKNFPFKEKHTKKKAIENEIYIGASHL